jgi:hypothetical protein
VIFDHEAKPVDYRFLESNPAFEKQTGLVGAQGKRMRELAPKHEEQWFETYGRIALTGQPARFLNRAEQLLRWYGVARDMRTPVQSVMLQIEALLLRATGEASWAPVGSLGRVLELMADLERNEGPD